jgi:nitroreductase
MNVWDAVRMKRAVRRFADRPVDPAQVERIVRAGMRAHSAKNQQRWAFVVVRERARLAALSKAGPYAGHVAGAGAAVALVTPDPRAPGQPLSVVWDVGGAAAQMMLVAWELGIGSCPATVYDQALARELLGYPDEMWCEYILSFGYPADPGRLTAPNRPGGRRPLDEVVFQERWRGVSD